MLSRLSLEQITAWDLPAPDFIDLAAKLGCEAVSLFVEAANPESAGQPIATDAQLRRACKERLKATGVRLNTAEVFVIAPDINVRSYRPALEAGAELDAKAATAIIFDEDEARAEDNVTALAQLAAEFNLTLNLEFIAQSQLRDLADAIALVKSAGAPNLGIVVDTLHWTRSGGTAADLKALDPALLGAVQLCDGPAHMPVEMQLFHEGFLQRKIPGEGEFRIHDFITALPKDRLIGVEVPLKDLADQGVPVEERARRAVAGARRALAQADYAI